MSIKAGPEQANPASGLQVGMKVQIIGEQGTYLVSHLDQRRHTVDLIPLNGGAAVRGVHVTGITVPMDRPNATMVRSLIAEFASDGQD